VASFHEQLLGAHDRIVSARQPADLLRGYDRLYQILDFFRRIPLVPFDATAQQHVESLKRQKVRIGTMDLRIAATALSRNLTLVTRNRADFALVPGLRLADWTA
jgi:tRNA(fMet)-specific endonuclease VapC